MSLRLVSLFREKTERAANAMLAASAGDKFRKAASPFHSFVNSPL
jgi:hypothetical protein